MKGRALPLLNGKGMILSAFVAGWLSDLIGERLVIVQAFLIEGLGLFVLLQARGFPAFLAAMFISKI